MGTIPAVRSGKPKSNANGSLIFQAKHDMDDKNERLVIPGIEK